MNKNIRVKSHALLPPSIKMTLIVIGISVSVASFGQLDYMKFILMEFIIILLAVMVIWSKVEILVVGNEIYRISNFVYFQSKGKLDLSNFDQYCLIKKKKTFSSTQNFRPTAKEYYSRECVDIILANSTKKTRKVFLSIDEKPDAIKISHILASELGMKKTDYKSINRFSKY